MGCTHLWVGFCSFFNKVKKKDSCTIRVWSLKQHIIGLNFRMMSQEYFPRTARPTDGQSNLYICSKSNFSKKYNFLSHWSICLADTTCFIMIIKIQMLCWKLSQLYSYWFQQGIGRLNNFQTFFGLLKNVNADKSEDKKSILGRSTSKSCVTSCAVDRNK